MVTQWLPLVFSAGWASGINAYAVVLVLGLVGRLAHLGQVPQLLTRPSTLIVAALLFTVELVADKVPYLDSAWDSVHTLIRPVIGGMLGVLMAGDASTWQQALGLTTGSVTALLSHLAKAGLRLGINTSPEPASNLVVSTAEDVSVAGVLSLALVAPWVAAAIAAVLLTSSLVIVVLIWGKIRSVLRKRRRRRQESLERSPT